MAPNGAIGGLNSSEQCKKGRLNMNKRVLIISFLSMFVVTGVAAWLYGFSGITALTVSSTEPLSFTDNLETAAVDTTSSSYSSAGNVSVNNNGGPKNMTVSLNLTVTDVSDGCDNSGDYSESWAYQGSPIADGDILTIPTGTTAIVHTYSLVMASCPQSIESSIELAES